MAARGFDKIALRVPEQWDAEWYRRHFRDVLAKGDARNVIPAGGLSVTGNTDEPATLTGSPDVATLMALPFVLTANSGSVANERKLTGSSTVTVTDGGANGNVTLTIPDDGVTYAKMQNISATSRFLGRISSGAGDTEELTPANATSLLNTFTSSLQGLVPASGGGTTTFLRADGSFTQVSLSTGVTGTLADGSLSSNVPLKNAANTFTAGQTINAPASTVGLTLAGAANAATLIAQGSSTTGQSYGIQSLGGTNASDQSFGAYNRSGGTLFFSVAGDGGIIGGSPTGGNKGAGTINAQGLYVNGVAVSTSTSGTDGTWTGTLTNISGMSGVTVHQGWYTRVGDTVTCGAVIDCTAAVGAFSFYLTIPVASAFTQYYHASGSATYNNGSVVIPVEVVAYPATDALLFTGILGTVGAGEISFTAIYRVI